MKSHRLVSGILAIVMCMVFVFPVFAEGTDKWTTVRVACGINKSLYINENGEAEGYCSEYLTELAKINKWNIEYVEGSWTESVQRLIDGEIDLLFPTQMTDQRKETMGFSTSIGGYQPIGLFANGNSGLCYDDFTGFDGARVALSAGTSNEAAMIAYAKENGFTFEPVYMNTTEEKMEALQNGTVDLIVFSTLNDVENGKVVAMLDYLPFYYCTNIENTALLKQLNYGMNQMLIRHPDTVENVFYSFMNRNISFAYTKEEQAIIDTQESVEIGVYLDTAPLFDVDENGNYKGIYVDIIERIKELSGLNIEIKALDRKDYAFDYLDRGEIDFVLGSSDQALRYSDVKGYVQSEGVMDYYTVNITKSDFSFSEDDNVRIALTGGRRYWEKILKEKYPNATFEYFLSSKECLDAIQQDKADITLLNSWEYNYHSKNQRFENLIEWENTRTLSQTVFVSLESENVLVRSILDKSIEQITNAQKEGIITANLNMKYTSYNFADRMYEIRHMLIIFGTILIIVLVGFTVFVVMRKKSMKVLEDKNQQLQSANELKNRFLSRMSHELRTPLNAINGYATVMEQNLDAHEIDENKARTHIQAILRAAKYQLAIIGDLLDIQKIESGKLELEPVEVDAVAYMNNIIDMIKPEANEKNIDFTYERLNTVNDTYFIDGVRLQQVLLNILHNAVKFTPVGGKVSMTTQVIDHDDVANTLKFVISDNGIGMSEDFQQNYLFHRFAQEYKGNTSPYEGCGTGLAISKEIIHLMGGEITCKSEQGKGSVFTVILTAKFIDKKKKRRVQKSYPSYDLTGIKILLCEDNQMNQDIERSLLERMKCVVDIADDGKIGVEKFSQSSENYYDMILMDIRMPNMDGFEATRAIRSMNRTDAGKVPILAVSANAFEEDVQNSLESGMNEHLAKPVDAKILYEKIKQYCKIS